MRKLELLVAAAVGALAVTTMHRAYAAGATPNASQLGLVVPVGTSSASFALSSFNLPCFVMASGTKGTLGVADMTVTVMADPNPGAGGLAWVSRGITNDGRVIPYSGFLSNAIVGSEPVMVNVTPDNPDSPGGSVYLVATWDAANKYSRYRVRNDSTRQQTVVITQIW